MKSLLRLTCLPVACLWLAACSTTPVSSWVPGYLTNTQGDLLLNRDGQCWRTAEWRPELAIAQCDPLVVAAWEAQKPAAVPPEEKPQQDDTPPAATAPAEAPQPGEVQTLATDKQSGVVAVTFVPLRLNNDISFGFNDANLTQAGKKNLTEFATRLRHSKAEGVRISIVGYADRIGLKAYNLDLSQRRADAVKAWLVSRGISAHAIDATGVGEAYPVTHLDDCADSLSRQALVQCFAPDRRVEISAQGKLKPEAEKP